MTLRWGHVDTAAILAAVGAIDDPELHLPLATLGMVGDVTISRDGQAHVEIALTTAACPLRERLQRDVEAAAAGIEGVTGSAVRFTTMAEHQRRDVSRLLAARRRPEGGPVAAQVYAVASGKGGVGKSSIAANLAVALAQQGKTVGLLDADVWGYSVPQLFGVRRRPIAFHGMMLPIEAHGVRLMSTGFLVEDETPIIWRGPMLQKALEQFIGDVVWGELDVLVLDLPPGTGDVTLSVLQLLPDAALIGVTTPQPAARTVASRITTMARDAQMPIAGVVENMSVLVCPTCGTASPMFGTGGGAELATQLGAPLLGQIPLDLAMRESGDVGIPLIAGTPDAPSAQAVRTIASALHPVRRSLIGRPLPFTIHQASRGGKRIDR